jgi:hypothetical protein
MLIDHIYYNFEVLLHCVVSNLSSIEVHEPEIYENYLKLIISISFEHYCAVFVIFFNINKISKGFHRLFPFFRIFQSAIILLDVFTSDFFEKKNRNGPHVFPLYIIPDCTT